MPQRAVVVLEKNNWRQLADQRWADGLGYALIYIPILGFYVVEARRHCWSPISPSFSLSPPPLPPIELPQTAWMVFRRWR